MFLRSLLVWSVLCCGVGLLPAAENLVHLPDDSLTAGISGKGPVSLVEIESWLSEKRNHEPLTVKLPLGLDVGASAIIGLEKNPLTRAKIELGRQLYFDTRLSADNTVSCASCHHPAEGYSKQTKSGVGIKGQMGGRNSPVSYNRILSGLQFWDGRAGSLEDQAVGPIANPIEMGNTHAAAVATVKNIPGYAAQFKAIFADGVTIENIGRALASFERVIVTGPSAYDYHDRFQPFAKLDAEDLAELKADEPESYAAYEAIRKGQETQPMSAAAIRGKILFFSQRVNCSACHVGANLADELYHNLGVGMNAEKPDVGRFEVTKDAKDWGSFKTPTIRNVEFSAPYMHDGSLATLKEVVDHYDRGGIANKNLSSKIVKIGLTPVEKSDLVAFMKACSGKFPRVEAGRLPSGE